MSEPMIVQGFRPGEVWKDTSGEAVQAHGGGILYHEGLYYWYGEHRGEGGHRACGISCYSSLDLYHWTYQGMALERVKDEPDHDLYPEKVLERPKVIYNDKTGQYVMWMHIDSPDYAFARAGAAVSSTPQGPFRYIGSIRPNGAMSRDMTVYKDEDGKAYLFHSSEDNASMYVSLLDDDYLSPEGTYTRNFIKKWREAPAVFKRDGKYYLITSGCTGWAPNEADCAIADSPMGPWEMMGNPCSGPDGEKTYYSQSTHVLPVEGKSDAYIFMADRWIKEDLRDSRYIWLPIVFEEDKLTVPWLVKWDLDYFDIK